MKKIIPYLLIGLMVAAIYFLVKDDPGARRRRLDERMTLRRDQDIPYGTHFAWEHLSSVFPQAEIFTENNQPGYWDSLSMYKERQVLLIIARNFYPDEEEMKKLVAFARRGNDIFISAADFSYYAMKQLDCDIVRGSGLVFSKDTLQIELDKPPFQAKLKYRYPGRNLSTYIREYNKDITEILAWDDQLKPVMARFRTGAGNIYIHTMPLTFTNYFILHRQNYSYYENVLSLLPGNAQKVVWDDYFMYKQYDRPEEGEKGSLSVLLSEPSFRAAFWLALAALILYILTEFRRKQRYIPVTGKPTNDSLDFVKTIGRLYYDKGDHRNLCIKMSSYFLEYVRSKYRLATVNLDENFVNLLRQKSGYPQEEIHKIVSFIKFLGEAPAVSDGQLTQFYNQLENFYNKT